MNPVGLADCMAPNWLDEFSGACQMLGLQHRIIAIGRNDWMEQVRGLGAFIWRPVMADPSNMAEIRTKIPLIEAMQIPCFPNSSMLWLYDDKIRETFFLRLHGYPMPETFVTFAEQEARAYVRQAIYPLVTKTHMGAASSGVMLLRSKHEAEQLLDRIFASQSICDKVLIKYHYIPRLARGDFLLSRRFRFRNACPRYAYFQKFIATAGDWRITTLGSDLVSVFVRRNRPEDFRASGSGLWERVAIDHLPIEACDLALHISNRHGFTSMTYDFMRDSSGWVIGEISFAFALNRIYSDTLFSRTAGNYRMVEPIPIAVMHLESLRDAVKRGVALPPEGASV